LTYPFVDAVVGKNPAQARNLHMGDYTNLSVQLDLNLTGQDEQPLPEPGDLCSNVPSNPLCDESGPITDTLTQAEKCILSGDPNSKACKKVSLGQVKETCKKKKYQDNNFCKLVLAAPDTPLDEPLPDLPDLPGLPLLSSNDGLFRPAFGSGSGATRSTDYDDELAPLLVWGMVQR
jgi:phospholipid/cholesterol/gamma-HCH transport system substrate-binding protein